MKQVAIFLSLVSILISIGGIGVVAPGLFLGLFLILVVGIALFALWQLAGSIAIDGF